MNYNNFQEIRNRPEIRTIHENVLGEDVTIISYMIGNKELWKLPYARECRGITFNSESEIISRPFEKFLMRTKLKKH